MGLVIVVVFLSLGLSLHGTVDSLPSSSPGANLNNSIGLQTAMVKNAFAMKLANPTFTVAGLVDNNVANGALEMSVPGTVTVRAGSSITFNVNASEPGNSNVTISLSASGLPNGASMASATGNPVVSTFAWAPGPTQPLGNYTLSFAASTDSKPPVTVSQTAIVEVLKAMLNPSLTVPTGTQAISAGTVLSFAAVATDLNLPPLPLIVSAFGLPTGATFNPDTGVFIWTPSESQAPGHYVVIFTATNGQGGITASKVTITVSGSALATTPLSTLPDWTMTWLLPLAIGLLIGIIPSVVLLLKRRRAAQSTMTNSVQASLSREALNPEESPKELPPSEAHPR
jgi:putative Ig domain-containing protein